MNQSLGSIRSRFFGSGFFLFQVSARVMGQVLVLLTLMGLFRVPNQGIAVSWPGDEPAPDEQRSALQRTRFWVDEDLN